MKRDAQPAVKNTTKTRGHPQRGPHVREPRALNPLH